MKKAVLDSAPQRVRMEERQAAALPGLVAGVVMGAHEGRPIVSWGSGAGPRSAETVWFEKTPDWSACCGVRVLLGFLDEAATMPIVVGFLERPPDTAAGESTSAAEKPKVLTIESEQELILECGKAKIALRADGKVQILGGYVVSHSTGVNRIRGGSVQIN